MKDKIIEILKKEQFNITDEAGNTYNVVEEGDFNDIAESIMHSVNQQNELLKEIFDLTECSWSDPVISEDLYNRMEAAIF